MLRAVPCDLLLLAVTCCTPPTPGASAVDLPAPPPATSSSAAAPGDAGTAREAPTGSKLLRIATAMAMGGAIDPKALVSELDGQLAPLEPCVALIRKTDDVVGSLNLQVTVATSGATRVELQSPVNTDAQRCLLGGMRAWRATHAGAGTAMVLLGLTDK